jgi:hypothetical protein
MEQICRIRSAGCERFKNVGTPMRHSRTTLVSLIGAAVLAILAAPVRADSRPPAPVAPPPHYADLADLADAAPLIARVQLRKITALEPGRAVNVRPGWGRFYLEARTQEVIFGRVALGEAVRFLADLPLDAKGKPPALKKKSVLLFARPVPARPGELQLIAPDAMLPWDGAVDARVRGILGELNAPSAPQKIRGVREAIHVPGNLAGEGETQIFLATADGEPAAMTVRRSPGRDPEWSVSFSEVVGEAGQAPAPDTLAWYRLACFLPGGLPAGTNVSGSPRDRTQALADYRFVLARLGPCLRDRGQ